MITLTIKVSNKLFTIYRLLLYFITKNTKNYIIYDKNIHFQKIKFKFSIAFLTVLYIFIKLNS